MPRLTVILAYDTAQVLDVTGPAAVFGAANDEVAGAYELAIASPRGGEIATNCGVRLGTMALGRIDPAAIDTLLIVGGDDCGLRDLIRDARARDWALAAARHARRVGSVCTGSFAWAAWGLLDGRRVATHWRAADELAAEGIDAEVIDLRSLHPYDWEAIKESVKKTNRVVCVNEDTEITNFGEHLIRRITEELFYELYAPPKLLAGAHVPGIGLADNLERASVPQKDSIKVAIAELAAHEP